MPTTKNEHTEDIKKLLTFNQRLNQLVEKHLSNVDSVNSRELLASIFMGKTIKTHKAVLLLCRSGFGEDAGILVRTLFETAINLLYIFKEKTNERMVRYAKYSWIIKEKNLKILSRTHHFESVQQNEIKKITDEAQHAQNTYKYRGTWSDKSIREMAEDVGRVSDYDIIYKFITGFAHTNAEALNHYVKKEADKVIVGTENNLVPQTLTIALEYFFIIAEKWNTIMKMGVEKEMHTIIKEYLNFTNSTLKYHSTDV